MIRTRTPLLVSLLALLAARPAAGQWVQQNTGFPLVNTGIASLDAVSPQVVWAAGYDGTQPINSFNGFTRTTNGGLTWTAGTVAAGPPGLNFANIAAGDGQSAWAAMFNSISGGGFLFRTTNGGTTWIRQNTTAWLAPGGFLSGVRAFGVNTGLAVGDPAGGSFEIYTTTSGGTTWTRVPAASVPAPLAGELTQIGTLVSVPIGAAGARPVWFGTDRGRVLRSTTSGSSWAVANTGLARIDRLAFSSATDGLAMDASNPNLLKRTTDGGATWTTLVPTGPIFATGLAGVPGTPGAYVSTGASSGGLGSSYSRDGGATWTAIDGGVAHTAVAFADAGHGWSGGFTGTAGQGGVYFSGVPSGFDPADPAPYCTAPHPSGCTGPSILAVALTGTALNNPSTCATTAANDAYTRYPATGATTATVQRGLSYTLSVTTDQTSPANASAWVDWNRNNAFDLNEWVAVYTNNTTGSVTLNVPATAVLGDTRLRIRSRVSTSPAGSGLACTSFGSGETEDYTLTVTGASTNPSNPAPYCIAPHPVGCGSTVITRVTLAGTGLDNASACSPDPTGNAYYNYPPTPTTTATVRRGQTYALTVTTDLSANLSAWADWNRNQQFEAGEWVQVGLGTLSGTTTFTVPPTAGLGDTRVRVRARSSSSANAATDACTSFGSGETEDYVLTVDRATATPADAALAAFSLAPNPTADGRVAVTLPVGTTALTVLDATGRRVRTTPVTPHQTEAALDLTTLPGGVYLVQVATPAGLLVKRLVKE